MMQRIPYGAHTAHVFLLFWAAVEMLPPTALTLPGLRITATLAT